MVSLFAAAVLHLVSRICVDGEQVKINDVRSILLKQCKHKLRFVLNITLTSAALIGFRKDCARLSSACVMTESKQRFFKILD